MPINVDVSESLSVMIDWEPVDGVPHLPQSACWGSFQLLMSEKKQTMNDRDDTLTRHY